MKTLKSILAISMLCLTLLGCGDNWLFSHDDEHSQIDTTAPQVETFYPDPVNDGEVSSSDIQTNGIKVIFSEAIDASSIDSTSFTVEEWNAGGTNVTGNVSYDPTVRTAKFIPDSALYISTNYVVTITTAVTDKSGNNLAIDYTQTITIAFAAPPVNVP